MGTLPNPVETSKNDEDRLTRRALRPKGVGLLGDEDQTNRTQSSPATRRKKGVQQQHEGEDSTDESSEEMQLESCGPPPKKAISNSQSDSGLTFPIYIGIAFAIVVIGLGLVFHLYPQLPGLRLTTSTQTDVNGGAYDNFKVMLEEFRRKFPLQGDETWRKIKSAVKSVTKTKSSKSPGVIAIVGHNGAESLAHCMGRALANILHSAYNDTSYIHIQGADYKKRDSDKVKFEIDTKITNGLQSGNHVVLIEGLHDLPPNSSLLFHGLCDNENAPFKESVFIFTSKVAEITPNEEDQEVTKMWQNDIGDDLRSSLETRIGNNIVIAKFGEQMTFPQECIK